MADRDFERPDPFIERVRDTLAPMPRVEPSDVARMLTAIHNRRAARTLRQRIADRVWFMRVPTVSMLGAGAVAVLALSVGFLGRGVVTGQDDPARGAAVVASADAGPVGVSTGNSTTVASLVAADSPEEMAVPVQFVLTVPTAQSVALVGDFNGWDASATPLEQVPGSSLWTTTTPLKPGRHVYAFVVDGAKWIRDPRAPQAVDEDFGRPQSVIVVQVPWTGR